MWGAIIGCSISPEQVVLCMAALKIAREAGGHEPDNVADAIGYMSLLPEVMGREAGTRMQEMARNQQESLQNSRPLQQRNLLG